MTSAPSSALLLALLALTAAPTVHAAAPASPTPAQEAAPLRYVRATKAAKVLNVPDANGIAVADVASDTLLAVYGERAGWLAVEPPQGLEVWVYGQFLRPTSQAGIVEVTGDNVRMRPKPSSAVESYPLEQQLHEGDRLRVLGRNDASKPLKQDWVHAISPPGVRGWIQTSATGAVEAGLDTRAAWTAAVQKSHEGVALADLRDPKAVAAEASAAKPAAKPDAPGAQDSWSSAEQMYAKAKAATAPDWAQVKAAYQGYLSANPNGINAQAAQARITEIGIREEIVAIQNDMKLREQQRQEGMADAQKRLEEAALASDPLWGRFQARGWLQRDEQDPSRWFLVWAGRPAAEISCASGRYDLSSFRSFEVGVIGVTKKTAAGMLKVDATRIEVLSARAGG